MIHFDRQTSCPALYVYDVIFGYHGKLVTPRGDVARSNWERKFVRRQELVLRESFSDLKSRIKSHTEENGYNISQSALWSFI